MSKQLEFDFMDDGLDFFRADGGEDTLFLHPDIYKLLVEEAKEDLNESIDCDTYDDYKFNSPADHNPCSSCPENGKGPCHCTVPNNITY